MIAIATTGLLAAAVIEITGVPALVVFLAPLVVLLVAILRVYRARPPIAPKTTNEALHAIPEAEAMKSATATTKDPEPLQAVDWDLRIRSAEASNDQAALASLYLAAARSEIAEGRLEEAAEQLRASVRAAVKSRSKTVQAEARLELAELARAAGDLTTACEHWQLARALFHELQDERVGKTETLMQKHGCPTDWVLNDF